MRLKTIAFVAVAMAAGCKQIDQLLPADPTSFTSQTLVSDLPVPLGMAVDERQQVWVTLSGTGKTDGQVALITTDNKVYPVVTGLSSEFGNGAVEGIGHLAYRAGVLYVLDGLAGKLYTLQIAGFKPGDAPYEAKNLRGEDISTFVLAQQLTTPSDSNPYNLTFGPDNNLYIVDAAANAIIKRDSNTKQLSVFAKLPNITPTTQAVPTGIVYDGNNFLVSGLSGFPYVSGSTKIYLVTPGGAVSVYQTGFTTLTDITLSASNKPIVLEFGQFSFTPANVGFAPGSGRVADGAKATLLGGLERPTDIERVSARTYYVLSQGDGTLKKLTY